MAEKKSAGKAERPPGSDPMEEYVSVTLYKGSEKEFQEDVFVSVNGETCLIQRGRPVKIKRKFALALRQNRRQDLVAATKIEEFEQK